MQIDTTHTQDTLTVFSTVHRYASTVVEQVGLEPSPVWTIVVCVLGVMVGVAILKLLFR